jgi:hypothetical protein
MACVKAQHYKETLQHRKYSPDFFFLVGVLDGITAYLKIRGIRFCK